MIKKPDVLSDGELRRVAVETFGTRDGVSFIFPRGGRLIQEVMERVSEHQLDADVKHYEPLIKEMCEALKGLQKLMNTPLDKFEDFEQASEEPFAKIKQALAKAEGK